MRQSSGRNGEHVSQRWFRDSADEGVRDKRAQGCCDGGSKKSVDCRFSFTKPTSL